MSGSRVRTFNSRPAIADQNRSLPRSARHSHEPDVVAQDLRLEFVVDRHRARRSVPGATPSASSYRRATPLPTDELADRARAEVAVHRGSAARCASSLGGQFGRHRRIGLAHRNSMRGEFSIARGASGTVMRHFVRARAFAAPAPVTALALGMTVPAASRVLIPASRPAQRFTPSEAAAAHPAVLLAPVTARADEHLAPASGTEKQSGIVHRSPRRGGLDDPRLPGNTAFGAVRKCGSGRSLGRDRQVSAVRGCVGLLADSDLTPTHERRHRRYARCARPLAGSIGSGGKTTTRPRRARWADSALVRFDRHSQFTRAVRHLSAHFHSHQQSSNARVAERRRTQQPCLVRRVETAMHRVRPLHAGASVQVGESNVRWIGPILVRYSLVATKADMRCQQTAPVVR